MGWIIYGWIMVLICVVAVILAARRVYKYRKSAILTKSFWYLFIVFYATSIIYWLWYISTKVDEYYKSVPTLHT